MSSYLGLEKPFVLLESNKNRWWFALSVFLFTWFFLFTFGVFNFNVFSMENRLYRTFLYSFFAFLILIFHFFVIQDILIKRHNIRNMIAWSFWLMFVVGSSNFLITSAIFQRYQITFSFLVINLFYVLLTGFLVIPVILLINHLFLLRQQLHKADKHSKKVDFHKSKTEKNDLISINSIYKSDHFEMDLSKILFLAAAGNYVDIHFIKGKDTDHKLIRTTLSSIEKQEIHPSLIRCQRGYIVNIDQVQKSCKIDGNDYLILKTQDIKVPLSKNYKELILDIMDGNLSFS